MRKRKLLVIGEYPTTGVANKVAKLVLGRNKAAFLNRQDIANVIKSNDFKKAPKTLLFLTEVKETARTYGSWIVQFQKAA